MSEQEREPSRGEPWRDRLRRRGAAWRLNLTAADGDVLADPAARGEAAAAVARAAGDSRLEVAAPESADHLIRAAVPELLRQGLRLLQLDYEPDAGGGNSYVALFLPSPAGADAPRPAAVLRHEAGGRTWPLTPQAPLVLGRDADCDVRLPSPAVSARHCAIAFARRAFTLLDLRSSAGTFLDNRPMLRGAVAEFGRVCLGRKETGHYLEMELRIPPGAEAFLHVISGPNAGQSIPLLRPVLTVGRAPSCDLLIDAPYVSREHLRLALVTDCYLLTDLASTNGTLHNGRPVTGGRLVAGDRIAVGEDRFTFHTADELDGFFQPGWRVEAGGRSAALDRPVTTLGREAGCDFLAGEGRLSRNHARLVWERPGRLRLYDLASFGGVAVGGRPAADAELRGGEVVALGPVPARVVAPE